MAFGLLRIAITIGALALMIYHWDLIDAAFVNFLEGAAGHSILPFAHADVVSTSSTTTLP
jgi:hypothetical protein